MRDNIKAKQMIGPKERKGWNLIISKFLAVYTCIAMTGFLALILGLAIDYFSIGRRVSL